MAGFKLHNNIPKPESGYAALRNVNTAQQNNRMESFFPAETLKYLYLLQDSSHKVDLLNKVSSDHAVMFAIYIIMPFITTLCMPFSTCLTPRLILYECFTQCSKLWFRERERVCAFPLATSVIYFCNNKV